MSTDAVLLAIGITILVAGVILFFGEGILQ